MINIITVGISNIQNVRMVIIQNIMAYVGEYINGTLSTDVIILPGKYLCDISTDIFKDNNILFRRN